MSFVDALAEDREMGSISASPLSFERPDYSGLASLPPYWVYKTREVLQCLDDLSTIYQLVREFYDVSQAAAVPAPLILNALEQMYIEDIQHPQITTLSSLVIPNRLEGNAFHELSTGKQLRLDIIGVLCAIAGQACCFALGQDKFRGPTGAARRAEFPKRMMVINDLVTTICRMVTLTNDLTIWTLHESVLISSLVHSYPSSVTWHRLGGLSTSIFEMGLHRDFGNPPIFLRESRHQVHRRSSWNRVRFLMSTFWEEILELSLDYPSSKTADQLRDISRRCQPTWESLPGHLHFSPTCWMQGLPVSVCLMLTLAYLTYLYNEFLMERLLVRHDPHSGNQLLDVSMKILSTVLTVAQHREHTLLLYGFPSASHTRNGKTLPYKGARGALIRDVSVFTSRLETIS
ncbi:hypothetical protein BO94DRAFT_568523 [Aspergillus sclerotioniger CBS 115572]|uniref:Transcription factor domain-containing protein n=1 Tax=Aspergillus sclerotioniger CBS 115572 TaxID=1450535 RepID=A0A317VTD8_9EURO|nr:hypothetical protein BO94DRAFT_568523 [Aspergillus sclerotioniger CBS 115572]PWY76108.1 hypothetical protein BO94DRAFT_568523 [Aspergillus sclerotioniger CBS 115572]